MCLDIHMRQDVLSGGMTAVVLSKLLGHKDVQTTLNTYTSVFNRFKEKEMDNSINYLKSLGLISEKIKLDNYDLEQIIVIITNMFTNDPDKFMYFSNLIKNSI